MYYLAEYWFDSRFAASVAGLVYGWNGLTIHCLMWPCHTAGLAWVPWVVWLCARASAEGGKQIWWAALAAGCQLLTGSPEGILLTWVVVGANLVVGRISSHPSHPGPISPMAKRAGRTLAVALAAAALSAAQLLPWFQLLSNGDRTAAAGSGFWSLPPWGLANFFVPLFHTSPSLSGVFMQDEQQWTSSYWWASWPWRSRRWLSGGREAGESSCSPRWHWRVSCWPRRRRMVAQSPQARPAASRIHPLSDKIYYFDSVLFPRCWPGPEPAGCKSSRRTWCGAACSGRA